ncbi:MAG: STAS domain-containing protein [Acidobacteria bacterium]|nr:STAS domain-containing protein [Acidobacteriota bacterium]MBV9483761.1 STAS domain-containing protein [Acidobacteriota bacterium]
MLTLRIQRLGDVTVLRCIGRITFPHADVLRSAILQEPRARSFVLDLANIMLVDAAGLGMLVSLRRWSRNAGTDLKLMNLTPRVDALLELTNLKSTFAICSSREMLELLCHAIHQPESGALDRTIQHPNFPDGLSHVPLGA